jgi:hypothetical protein
MGNWENIEVLPLTGPLTPLGEINQFNARPEMKKRLGK